MDQYALYLRKSRADVEAEARGEGETLSKHRAALTEYARRRGLLIVKEYAEIVSGDTIAARPQMQHLIEDVKAGLYAGVIVNDIDRLGRGDGIDQEIIKYTFAAVHCIIITPNGDIDPASNRDEDMLDFRMFFARMELRKTSQRMAQGRARSALSGNWIAGSAPFGYKKVKSGRKITLEPDESTAPILRLIFDWYATGEAGYTGIANRINRMGVKVSPQPNAATNASTIRRILSNPIYIGKLAWGKTESVSRIENGQRVKRRVKSTPTVIDDAFPPLIDVETWNVVQDRIASAHHIAPVNSNSVMQNPLAGLVICSECGRHMVRIQGHNRPILQCPRTTCKTSGAYIDVIEDTLLEILRTWCVEYSGFIEPVKPQSAIIQIEALRRQLEQIDTQITRAQELVEIGVYSPSEYVQRKTALEGRRSGLRAEIDKLTRPSPRAAVAAAVPEIRRVLDAYPLAPDAAAKNRLLRSVIDHIIYYKTKSARGNKSTPGALLSLDVFPVINRLG